MEEAGVTTTEKSHIVVFLNGASSRGTDSGSAPGELLLTDPEGKRIGYDLGKGRLVMERQFGYYDPDYENDHAESESTSAVSKELQIGAPKPGRYTIHVYARTSGRYNLSLGAGFSDGRGFANRSAIAVAIQAGAIHTYRLWYDPSRVKDTRLELAGR